ncbi:hypothetical protein ACWDUM_00630 [Rhodococcus sp. NPDC003322]
MPVTTAESLTDHAFGPTPGHPALPEARSAHDRWLRAVALGGQGRYAGARAELAALRRERPGAVLASLAASTEASLLRQLGWHRIASGSDGRALVLAGDDRSAAAIEARCDALTGLAADALGCGRLALGFRLLDRCAELIDGAGLPGGESRLWRQRIRLHWVTAEMSLAAGDSARGRRHAGTAVELAGASPSVRHQVKSELLLAAAISAGADPAAAADPARRVLARCEEHGLVPLQWAASMLLGGVAPGPEADEIRRRCESRIVSAGGRFRES